LGPKIGEKGLMLSPLLWKNWLRKLRALSVNTMRKKTLTCTKETFWTLALRSDTSCSRRELPRESGKNCTKWWTARMLSFTLWTPETPMERDLSTLRDI